MTRCKCGHDPAVAKVGDDAACGLHAAIAHVLGQELETVPVEFPWADFKKGDRVELVYTTDPWTDLPVGIRGTMLENCPGPKDGVQVRLRDGRVLSRYTLVQAKWDNGSWLQMIPEAGDVIIKVEPEEGLIYDSGKNAWVKEES